MAADGAECAGAITPEAGGVPAKVPGETLSGVPRALEWDAAAAVALAAGGGGEAPSARLVSGRDRHGCICASERTTRRIGVTVGGGEGAEPGGVASGEGGGMPKMRSCCASHSAGSKASSRMVEHTPARTHRSLVCVTCCRIIIHTSSGTASELTSTSTELRRSSPSVTSHASSSSSTTSERSEHRPPTSPPSRRVNWRTRCVSHVALHSVVSPSRSSETRWYGGACRNRGWRGRRGERGRGRVREGEAAYRIVVRRASLDKLHEPRLARHELEPL